MTLVFKVRCVPASFLAGLTVSSKTSLPQQRMATFPEVCHLAAGIEGADLVAGRHLCCNQSRDQPVGPLSADGARESACMCLS